MNPSTRVFRERPAPGTWGKATPAEVPCCKCGAPAKLPDTTWYRRQWKLGKVKCPRCAAARVSQDAYSRYPGMKKYDPIAFMRS